MAIQHVVCEGKSEEDEGGGETGTVAPEVGEDQGEKGQADIQGADLCVGVTADDETLVEVRAMRSEDVLTFDSAADECDARVHDESPKEERAEHERVAFLVGGEQRHDRKTVTEEGAGNVAHENFGGMPVVSEKTETARGDGERDPKHERVRQIVDVGCEQCPAQTRRERDAARNAVDAVHEVVGVRESDDP